MIVMVDPRTRRELPAFLARTDPPGGIQWTPVHACPGWLRSEEASDGHTYIRQCPIPDCPILEGGKHVGKLYRALVAALRR